MINKVHKSKCKCPNYRPNSPKDPEEITAPNIVGLLTLTSLSLQLCANISSTFVNAPRRASNLSFGIPRIPLPFPVPSLLLAGDFEVEDMFILRGGVGGNP